MWQDPLSTESVEQNLKDAGCPAEFIRAFLEKYFQNTPEEQMRLLKEQRRKLLDQLHDSQRHLDCMDFLCYQIQKLQAKEGRQEA